MGYEPDPADSAHITGIQPATDAGGNAALVIPRYFLFNGGTGFHGKATIEAWYDAYPRATLASLLPFNEGADRDEMHSIYFDDAYTYLASKRWVARLDMRDGTFGFGTGIPSQAGGANVRMVGTTAGPVVFYNPPPGSSGGGTYIADSEFNFSWAFKITTADPTARITAVSDQVGDKILMGFNGRGVYRSTNGGRDFASFNDGLPASARVDALWLNALIDEAMAIVNAEAYIRSVGALWRRIAFGPGFTPRVVTGGGSNVFVGGEKAGSLGFAWSPDHGNTFTERPGPPGNRVYCASYSFPESLLRVGTNAGLFSSSDGVSWQDRSGGMKAGSVRSLHLSGGSGGQVRAFLAAAPTLYVGSTANLNGVYKSTDGGRTYAATGSALDNQIVWDIEEVSGVVIAALNTGVARSTDGGANWTILPPSAGIPASTQVLALETVGNAVIAATYLRGAYRSTDAGATWQAANTGLPANAALYSLHETAGGVIAGGVNRVYRSTNAGLTWTPGGVPSPSSLHVVYSLAGTDTALYAGIYDAAGPQHGISKSTDGGATWAAASSGLPRAPVNTLLEAGGALFAGNNAGLFRSTDAGSSWSVYGRDLVNTPVYALVASQDTLFVGTGTRAVVVLPLRPRVQRLVPIVLDVYGIAPTHFTTELNLVNRGTTNASVTMQYTASIGSGSGTATETVRAGQQLVIPDAIAYLIGKGVPIPPPSPASSQGGTLLVTFEGLSEEGVAGVTARTATDTTAPEPAGRAGLAYSAIDPATGTTGILAVFGLRSDAADRSNFAVFNTSAEPVSVRVTAYSGAGEGSPKVVGDLTLPPWGWQQLNEVLQIGSPAFTNGWVVAQRTSATGSFSGYGVVNDRRTGDGSYLLAIQEPTPLLYVNVPVLVETGAFESELVLTNANGAAVQLDLVYKESLSPALGAGGTVTLSLAAGEQRIIPGAINFLRSRGAAIGPRGGGSYVGSLHVVGEVIFGIYAGARTASPSSSGGQYGLFTGGAFAGTEARSQAFIYGLRADDNNRTNVAVIHTGASTGAGPITLELTAYDGDAAGVAKGTKEVVVLQPGQWYQSNSFLANRGVRNGWVGVRRTAGTGYFLAYGVVNDGGAPGQRTGDGAYVPMETQDARLFSASPLS